MTPRYIYLHGFASSPSSRKAQFFRERFEERGIELRIPVLDEGDFTNLTVGGQLSVIAREAAGAPLVVLLGSSLGGYLSALYAARHSEVKKLVLLAPAFSFPGRWQEALGEAKIREWRERGSMEMLHYGTGSMRPISYRLIEEAAGYEDYPNAKQPALILHGTEDDVVPAAFSQEFVRRNPDSAKLVLLASGHELTDVLDKLWNETARFLELP